MNKFLSLLGIKTGEGPMIGNLWFLGFFLGAKLTVFTAAITALFLREFDASALPYMYIGGALLTVSFGSFFGWIGKRLSDQALFGIYLLFMIAATVAL